jgi:general secretion pathway protein D
MRRGRALLLVASALLGTGCAARSAYREGQSEAKKGNWDVAVARLTVALQKDPENISYKIALENARIQASRAHYDLAQKAAAAQELDRAAEELEIAVKYDGGNKSAADDLAIMRERIRKRDDEKRRLAEFERMQGRSQLQRLPLPVLSPRSPVPIRLKFVQTSIQTVLDTLAKLAGVNILYDQDYRDKKGDVDLTGVTFQEALDRITFTNRLFYKVLDQNTVIVVPETPAKRRTYDEQVLRTFYLINAEAAEVLNLVKTLAGITKSLANKELQSITVLGTPDKVALAERIVLANDKSKGEVLIEIQILNVNTDKAKEYGLRLSNYGAGVTFSPSGAAGELTEDGFTNVRAHLLSSFNLADFVVSVPSSLFTRFLQTENTTRILAAPRLRAAEGKKTSLKIGQEVPVPVTTFQATQTGGTTFTPATSFQYRNVGVQLDITPKVNPTGDITLEIAAEFNQLGQSTTLAGQDLPTFLTRNVTGFIRIRDGETSLLGGLVQRSETDAFTGILGLQSVPVLNKIFTSRAKVSQDQEILISITPHILRAPKVLEGDLAGMLVGTEEIPRVEGARPPLFGPPTEGPGTAVPRGAVVPPPPAPAAVPPRTEAAEPPLPPPPAETAVPGPAGPALTARRMTAQLSPPEVSVKVGDTVTVSLLVMGLSDVTAVDAVLGVAPGLEVVESAPGQLLTLDGVAVGAERSLETGRARVKFTRPSPTSGSGVVLTLRLRAVRPGDASVVVESLSLVTPAGAEAVVAAAPTRVVVNP